MQLAIAIIAKIIAMPISELPLYHILLPFRDLVSAWFTTHHYEDDGAAVVEKVEDLK